MTKCKTCTEDFSKLGLHWYHNPKHRTEYSDEQIEILTGVLMGDGTLNYSSNNPRIVIEMVNKEYLEEIDKLLGELSCGVSIKRTSKENKKRGVFGDSSGNYQDTYVLKTRRHPELSMFKSWYTENGKSFPEDLSLTPLVLKHWHVCDGYFRNQKGHNSIEIGVSNESDNRRKINKYFSDSGLPEPTWYDKGNSTIIRFTNDDSIKLFDYMGDPPEGFSYKFI